jgi:hypothetical protein
MWLFRCDCGKETVAQVSNVVRGSTKSCGGHHHRHAGKRRTGEYNAWQNMLRRCRDERAPCYGNYGGRGICVCERWNVFENFLADMGPRPSPQHSIDRINNEGNYEPSNCRWATRAEQANNTRTNRRLTALGRTETMETWARLFSMNSVTLLKRLESGLWTERALLDGGIMPNRVIVSDAPFEERAKWMRRFFEAQAYAGESAGANSHTEIPTL